MEYFIKWLITSMAWIVFIFSLIVFMLWVIDKLSGKDPMRSYYKRT